MFLSLRDNILIYYNPSWIRVYYDIKYKYILKIQIYKIFANCIESNEIKKKKI